MTDLSPNLQRLVSIGKTANRPSAVDFNRVRQALHVRLGDAAAGIPEIHTANVSDGLFHGLTAKAVAIGVAVLAMIGGGFALLSASHRDATGVMSIQPVANEPERSTAAAVDLSEDRTPTGTPAVVASSTTSSRSDSMARSREVPRSHDRLSEEVAILSSAETELHAGRAESALSLLNEHQRKFPSGILAEERTAARIQALCSLGRIADANALLARLRPGSLHGERSRQACGSDAKKSLRQSAGGESSASREVPP